MADRPEPYVRRDPGDVIRSGDWNEVQVQTREEVYHHRHTGGVDGLKIPRTGIEPKAVNGSLIDPATEATMKKLMVNDLLTVDTITSTKGLTVKGELKVDAKSVFTNLSLTGKLGINTTDPKAALDVNGSAFLGHETTLTDFGAILQSGFYQNGGKNVTGDVPDSSHPWSHMIVARHSNQNNNHQLQIASSYAENDKLFFRKIAHGNKASKNTTWHEVATREQEDWHTPTLLNGWVRYNTVYNPPGYFKDNMGIVHLRGLIKNGGISKDLFHLPAGFKPQYRELQPVQTHPNTIGRVDILADGRVHVVTGNAGWLALDGITFRAHS